MILSVLFRISTPPVLSNFSTPSPPPETPEPFYVSEVEVARDIRSFPPRSSGGPNGLCPQYLKDMLLSELSDSSHSPLLSTLAAFASLVLEGQTPPTMRHFIDSIHEN